jgi:5'-methylthioadenosine phosphorylase
MKMQLPNVDIGVIGGSGFYNMKALSDERYLELDTPFGFPTEKIRVGILNGQKVAFLARHGIGHRFSPSEVNYRANLFAMKLLKVTKLISVTAVGSLKEELEPTSLVIPDQYVDLALKRKNTFFGDGIVAHVSMAEPTCAQLTGTAFETARELGLNVTKGGTYLNIEGPQFSSRAESLLFRDFGFSVIGMTQAIESKLAKELEMCFLPLSFVTDYDCWHGESESVSVELVVDNLAENADNAVELIKALVDKFSGLTDACACASALENAFITDPGRMPRDTRIRLKPIIEKYISME